MADEKILVVDDEPHLGELFREVLTEEGFSVDVATQGKQALDMVNTNEYNVALVDLILPDVKGVEILKYIKDKGKQTQVIIITGFPTIESAIETMKIGAYDYIQKPVNITELSLLVKKCLETQRLLKESSEAKKIKALYRISKEMSSTINLDRLLELILKFACDTVSAGSGSLMLLDEESGELEMKEFKGLREDMVKSSRVKIGKKISGWIAQHKGPMLLVNGLENYPQFKHLETRPEIKMALCIPLKIKDKLTGVLNVNILESSHTFTEDDKELLVVFAQDAAMGIENAKLYEETVSAKHYIENIIKNIIDALIVTDAEARIKTVNQALLDLLGYEAEELVGKPSGILFEEEGFFEGKGLEELLREGSVRSFDMTYETKTGEKIPVSFAGSIMKDIYCPHNRPTADCSVYKEKGKHCEMFLGMVGIARDMREMKHIQAQLVQSAKMAAVGEIGAGVVHELNNPLAGISMLVNVLRKRMGPENPNYSFLEEIKKAAEHCAKIVHDLLNFSRRDKGEFNPIDCNEAINGVLTFVGHQVELKKIKIVKNLQPDLPPVLGNIGQLQQVFLNMITNAKDAMSEGGILTIASGIEEGENESVKVEFTDTGCGIEPKNIERIFESFFSTKKTGQGLGLGLAISNEIIKKHEGSVKIKSEVGKGTTFTLKFPCNEIA